MDNLNFIPQAELTISTRKVEIMLATDMATPNVHYRFTDLDGVPLDIPQTSPIEYVMGRIVPGNECFRNLRNGGDLYLFKNFKPQLSIPLPTGQNVWREFSEAVNTENDAAE